MPVDVENKLVFERQQRDSDINKISDRIRRYDQDSSLRDYVLVDQVLYHRVGESEPIYRLIIARKDRKQ